MEVETDKLTDSTDEWKIILLVFCNVGRMMMLLYMNFTSSRGVRLSVLSKDNIKHQSELVAGAEVKVPIDTWEEA